ncbi:MAG: histone deacetylase family protein [Alphaproteobacteria bacterium]|nr:histone deacetylase family protein [Alphaproteobacteria bacterium]
MTTFLFSHPACIEHDPSPSHPESPERLRRVLQVLEAPEFEALERREAPQATTAQIALMHPESQINRIFSKIPQSGYAQIDADTIASPGSGEAALHAAGALVAAVDAVMAGEADNAFCAVRPPGHHAEAQQSMGFCLFNNIAIGAAHARTAHGLGRIAVMDFDVHHGNGTQAMFWDEPDMLYTSTHQSPLYPGTGSATERGASGNIINAPLPPGAGSEAFRAAMGATILPAIRRFEPEFLFISAGFDAHLRDPLAQLQFTTEDYRWATETLCEIADGCCDGRVVSTLEGGYDLDALGDSVAAHVQALMVR